MSQQCVKVILVLESSDLGRSEALERELSVAIESAGVGEYDGNEIGDGKAVFYMYGTDADAIYEAIEPVLRASSLAGRGTVVRRYGPPQVGVREVKTAIGTAPS